MASTLLRWDRGGGAVEGRYAQVSGVTAAETEGLDDLCPRVTDLAVDD
jgi:hypothetical protein